jgi:hypothetical protein
MQALRGQVPPLRLSRSSTCNGSSSSSNNNSSSSSSHSSSLKRSPKSALVPCALVFQCPRSPLTPTNFLTSWESSSEIFCSHEPHLLNKIAAFAQIKGRCDSNLYFVLIYLYILKNNGGHGNNNGICDQKLLLLTQLMHVKTLAYRANTLWRRQQGLNRLSIP